MKILKLLAVVVALGGVLWWGTDVLSPHLTVRSVNTEYVYGDTITFRTNIINFSPQTKEVYISEGDYLEVSLLIDDRSSVNTVPKELAGATIPIIPFYNKTIEHTVTLQKATTAKQAQLLSPSDNTLMVTPGKHSVRANWGGHTSGVYTFGVR